MKTFKEYNLDDKINRMVIDAIKKKKLAKFPVNATDDYKMKKGKPAFTIPSPTGSMIIKVWLRPMAKPAPKTMMAYNYELDDKQRIKMDKKIKRFNEYSSFEDKIIATLKKSPCDLMSLSHKLKEDILPVNSMLEHLKVYDKVEMRNDNKWQVKRKK